MRIVNNIEEFEQKWDDIISDLPGAHFLQTREWGQIKTNGGWITIPAVWEDDTGNPFAAALILERSIKLLGFIPASILYVPRGPLVDWKKSIQWKTVIRDLAEYARKRGAIFIKIDPECLVGTGIPSQLDENNDFAGKNIIEELKKNGWKLSQDQIQYRNTVWINLELTEDDWLARLKQKTRYNIRLAQKKGVEIVEDNSNEAFECYLALTRETVKRQGFYAHSETYHRLMWQHLHTNFVNNKKKPVARLLTARFRKQIITTWILFQWKDMLYYPYGASTREHREVMPTYALFWEAIKFGQKMGCHTFDMWGTPGPNPSPRDPYLGFHRFKEGFGAELVEFLGTYDLVINPTPVSYTHIRAHETPEHIV